MEKNGQFTVANGQNGGDFFVIFTETSSCYRVSTNHASPKFKPMNWEAPARHGLVPKDHETGSCGSAARDPEG